MYKRSLIYSLKIWAVCIILSPALCYIFANNYSEAFDVRYFFVFWAYSLLYGLVLSLPGYFLFLLANFYLGFRKWSDLTKKVVLGGWASLLIVASVILVFGHDDSVFLAFTIKLAFSYILSVICAIIFV